LICFFTTEIFDSVTVLVAAAVSCGVGKTNRGLRYLILTRRPAVYRRSR